MSHSVTLEKLSSVIVYHNISLMLVHGVHRVHSTKCPTGISNMFTIKLKVIYYLIFQQILTSGRTNGPRTRVGYIKNTLI